MPSARATAATKLSSNSNRADSPFDHIASKLRRPQEVGRGEARAHTRAVARHDGLEQSVAPPPARPLRRRRCLRRKRNDPHIAAALEQGPQSEFEPRAELGRVLGPGGAIAVQRVGTERRVAQHDARER